MSMVSPRNFVQAAVVGVVLLTGRAAFADPIAVGHTLHLLNPGGTIWGGVFNVDDLDILPNYPNDPDPPAFDLASFCLQIAEDINDTDDFVVEKISTVVDESPDPDPSDGIDGDPLDDRTAWIYSQFRAGSLGSFTEDEIQAAIWEIEDEWEFSDANAVFGSILPSLAVNAASLKALADAAVAGGWRNEDVLVLTLRFAPGTLRAGDKAQDLLMLDDRVRIESEAPEPATILLLGSGAAALIRRRVRNRRSSETL